MVMGVQGDIKQHWGELILKPWAHKIINKLWLEINLLCTKKTYKWLDIWPLVHIKNIA
jgi:hypothetical protein